jgi:hypothetical protein
MAPLFFAVKVCRVAWASGELTGAGVVKPLWRRTARAAIVP